MLTTAAAEVQALADLPAGIAALLGGIIGGLFGLMGHVVSERLRRKGELRHQNRLLLQETYIETLGALSQAVRASELMRSTLQSANPATTLVERVNAIDEVAQKLRELSASIRAVGALSLNTPLDQMVGWLLQLLRAGALPPGPERVSLIQESVRMINRWEQWIVATIRFELKVDRQSPGDPPPILEPTTENTRLPGVPPPSSAKT